jgi:hypothetical protein
MHTPVERELLVQTSRITAAFKDSLVAEHNITKGPGAGVVAKLQTITPIGVVILAVVEVAKGG